MRDWQVLGDQVRSRIEAADKGTAVAFAALVASRAIDAADYRVRLASDAYEGDEDVDFEAEAEAAMATEAQQQLAGLDALVPYAAQPRTPQLPVRATSTATTVTR